MHEFLDNIGKHGNVNMSDQDEVNYFDELRNTASILFGCSPKNLGILSSASDLLNQIPFLLSPKAGSRIILISNDFPALYRPWQAYSKMYKIKLEFLKEIPNIDLNSVVSSTLGQDVSAIVISYVQYSTGSIIDIKSLYKITKKLGIKLIIDVTQAAGAIPINVKNFKCDALICSGYKWLGGHGGVGLAVLSNELIKSTPLMPGWMGARNPFDISHQELDLAEGAKRFTQSTMSYISLKGLEVSIQEILKIGVDNIDNHAQRLKRYFLSHLNKSNFQTFHQKNIPTSSHIVSIFDPKKNISRVAKLLSKNNIFCSIRNGYLRVSFAHYNNQSDIDKLLSILKED
tara:strand:+ start:1 stop:1032 length:1032 start_codon:yes stop_codon:yes gene_type:complete